MTILDGNRPVSPNGLATPSRLSADLGELTVDYWQTPRFSEHPRHTSEMRAFVSGSFGSDYPYNLPVDAGFEIKGGNYANSYKQDLYYRVHLTPRLFNFGSLINDEVQELVVWNANFHCVYLQAVSEASQPGVSLSYPAGVTVPYVIKPTEEIVFEVSASIAGPPVVNAEFEITIDDVGYEVRVIGRRILLWPFPPNWSSPLDDTYAFRSWALRSADGHVQSGSQWGNNPRREISYSMALRRDDAARADNLLIGWQSRFYGAVVWTEEAPLTAPAVAGSRTLPCITADRSFAVGSFAVLYVNSTTYETVEIESVAAGSIGVTADLTDTWPVGTKVYPVLASLIGESVSGVRHTDGVVEMSVSFESEPSTTAGNTATPAAPLTYKGEELYLGPLNWADAIPFQYQTDRDKIDFNTARVYSFSESGFSPQQKDHTWYFKSRSDATLFRQWLGRREGIARPVYMPTGNSDLTMIADPVIASPVMDVVNVEYGIIEAHPARRDIIVVMRDGSYYLRRIVASETLPGGDGTRLTLDQNWPTSFSRENVKRISFLGLFRQVSNKATIRWVTENVGTATLSLITDRTD